MVAKNKKELTLDAQLLDFIGAEGQNWYCFGTNIFVNTYWSGVYGDSVFTPVYIF
jgi:hypothetical protein